MAAKATAVITPLVAMGAIRSLTSEFIQLRHSSASARGYQSDSEDVRWVSGRWGGEEVGGGDEEVGDEEVGRGVVGCGEWRWGV